MAPLIYGDVITNSNDYKTINECLSTQYRTNYLLNNAFLSGVLLEDFNTVSIYTKVMKVMKDMKVMIVMIVMKGMKTTTLWGIRQNRMAISDDGVIFE